MIIKERIIDYLMNHPEGIDDDNLSFELKFGHRQQANSICRQLESEGLVKRTRIKGKTRNFWIGKMNRLEISSTTKGENNFREMDDKPWYWEGNVQLKVVTYLEDNGFKIRSVTNTAEHQKGKDIIAEKNGKELWITAKGYPKDTAKTKATTQADHWFKDAVFDIIKYYGQNNSVSLGIAFPNFHKYHFLSEKIVWFKKVTNFKYYWVDEKGDVSID